MGDNVLKFTIDGEVQPQERPRFSRRGNFVNTYDPPKSAKYKKYVAEVAEQYRMEELIDSAIRLSIDVYRSIPKSTTKKDLKRIENEEILHIKKPDIENLVKGVMDGITGVLWKDDSLIVELHVKKHYSHNPRAEVKIEW